MRMLLALSIVAIAASPVQSTGPRFGGDDPVARVVDAADASAVRPAVTNHDADAWHAVRTPQGQDGGRARNLNTLGEVPDSSWFTNRIGASPLTTAAIVRGPDTLPDGPQGPWTIVGGKSEGITPGLRLTDRDGRLYFVKVDPRAHPELASGAEVISTKLLHALGYHVPENYLVVLRPDEWTVSPDATIRTPAGVTRRMTRSDVRRLLAQAARRPDGGYRVLASLRLPGTPLGPFRYSGTRPDDPNDIVPHEDRRELRALRVFAAWLNHVDTKSQNTLDTLVPQDARRVVRHHLIDFGSTLGSNGTGPKESGDGFEYLFDTRRALLSFLSFGTYRRAWDRISYPDVPSIGRIAATGFDVATWKPTFPNAAFDRARADDLFWAAQRVVAFSDEAIRAVVAAARFSDPAAGAYLADTLIARRDQIGRALLPSLNPVTSPAVVADHLTFGNAAVEAGAAAPPHAYTVRWFAFDNTTHAMTALTPWLAVSRPEAPVPAAPGAAFLAVEIAAPDAAHPAWAVPVCAYFRRGPDATWSLVGFDRLPSR